MTYKLFAVFGLLVGTVFGTTLTGTLNGPDGTGINGNLYLSLSQQAALQSTGGCGGPIEVVPGILGPSQGYSIAIKVVNGALVSPPTIYGNDCMLPGGLYYNVLLTDNNGNTYFTDKWQITGSSIDIGTIVSVVITGTTQTLGSTGFVQLVPAGTQTINQPSGTYLGINTMAVTGVLTLPDGSQCTTSGCFAFSNVVTLTGNQTIAGNKTFTADVWGNGLLASIGTPTNPFYKGNFVGDVSASLGMETGSYNTNCGTTGFPCYGSWQMAGTTPSTYVEGMFLYAGGNAYNIWTYRLPTTTPTLTMGASLNPGNTSYNLGSAALPWNNVVGQNVTATGTLTVGPVGSFYNRIFSGSNISCTGVNDGWQGVRTDTKQVEFCVGGAAYGITASAL